MPGEVMGHEQIMKALGMTLYASAARRVATTEQLLALRRTLVPALEQYRSGAIDEDGILALVDEAMGDWNVPADYQAQLDEIGFTWEGARK